MVIIATLLLRAASYLGFSSIEPSPLRGSVFDDHRPVPWFAIAMECVVFAAFGAVTWWLVRRDGAAYLVEHSRLFRQHKLTSRRDVWVTWGLFLLAMLVGAATLIRR